MPLILMLALFCLGMPIVFAIGFCTFLYALFVAEVPLLIIPQQIMSGVDSFLLLAVPLFVLAGAIMGHADVTRRLVNFSLSIVGWIRGGLALVNVMTSVFMAGISGSALADTAATGSSLVPAMKRGGYSAEFSAAVTACSSIIGPIIPPSLIMVVVGGLTSISVGRMFLGGVVPGLILAFLFGLACYIISRRRQYPIEANFSLKIATISFWEALPSLGLPLIIIGGIMSGVFTPTESAGVAVVYVILLGLIYKKLGWKDFYRSVVETGVMTGTVLFIVGVSAIFGWVLISENAGEGLGDTLLAISNNPTVVLLLITIILVAAGLFMEVLAVLILSIPVFMPIVTSVGIDPVHFAVLATVALAAGLVTPPFGLCMFLICKLADVKIETFAKESIPFYICIFFTLALLIVFPEVVLWLPNTLMGAPR